MRSKVVGQNDATEAILDAYELFQAGLNDCTRPIASLLFLGPTGVGKTRCCEAMAESLFHDQGALVRIDCGEFQHSHEISKVIGSPPGYLGHRETTPRITKEALEAHWSEGLPRISLILFDEIEKAHSALFDLLLGVLDRGELRLGDGRLVILTSTMVFMTSNLGARGILELAAGGLGFAPALGIGHNNGNVSRTAESAARKKFSPEFFNRISRIVVFRSLSRAEMELVLDLEIDRVQQRVLASPTKFVLRLSQEAREFLLREGTDARYGARPLKRAIERHVTVPLAGLMAAGNIETGDSVLLGVNDGSIVFDRMRDAVA